MKFSRPSHSTVVAYLALFLVLTGGTALAIDGSLPGQNTVGSADVINGEVTNVDLGPDSVTSGKIANGEVKNAELGPGASSSNTIADGGVEGIDVKNNTLTGDDIASGSVQAQDLDSPGLAPVAIGSFGGICNSDTDCPMEFSQGVTDFKRIDSGDYCIEPKAEGSVIVVGNWWGDIHPVSVTGVAPASDFCDPGEFEVLATDGDGRGFSFVIY